MLTVVGIVLVVLKLANLIQLSWIWVLCPFWIGFAIFFVFLIVVALIAGFAIIAKLLSN